MPYLCVTIITDRPTDTVAGGLRVVFTHVRNSNRGASFVPFNRRTRMNASTSTVGIIHFYRSEIVCMANALVCLWRNCGVTVSFVANAYVLEILSGRPLNNR